MVIVNVSIVSENVYRARQVCSSRARTYIRTRCNHAHTRKTMGTHSHESHCRNMLGIQWYSLEKTKSTTARNRIPSNLCWYH